MLILLVVLSALLHAWWNARLKALPERDGAAVAALAVAALLAAVVAGAQFLVHGRAPFPATTAIAASAVAGIFEGLYFLALIAALNRAPLNAVYTVSRGGAILLVWPLSLLFLGERLSASGALGATLVLAGLLCAGGRDGLAGGVRGDLRPALLAAGAIAGYHLAYKVALDAHGDPAAVFALSLAIAVPVNLAPLAKGGRLRAFSGAFAARPAGTLFTGVVCCTAFLIFMVALARGGAGFVLTLRNISIVFAALLARLQGERVAARQWAGAALATLGALVMGLG